MEYQNWTVKDPEWDLWWENSLIFPKDKTKEEYFTKENLFKLYHITEADIEYYDNVSIVFDTYTVYFNMIHWEDDWDAYTHAEFVQRWQVLILD